MLRPISSAISNHAAGFFPPDPTYIYPTLIKLAEKHLAKLCSVPQGALFYAETRRRELVPLTPALRAETQAMADEMNRCFARGHTPKVKPGKHCNACSLKKICLPVLCRRADPAADSLRFYQLGNHYKSRVEHVGPHPEFAQDDVLLL